MATFLRMLHGLPGPGPLKLITPLGECQISWLTKEKASKMHMKDVVSQALPFFSIGFEETRVQREAT